ncbi:hypothetical protein [Shimia sp.]|uniref:hypothetical protein n=1 Tax=Shimia sp. TaxID=1954381 RepID=UPI003BA906E2
MFDIPVEQTTKNTLVELMGTLDTSDQPNLIRRDAIASLESRGFTNANTGEGILALAVATHPDIPDRVYKLVHTDTQQDPYLVYASWVYENKLWEKNPHFPRIFEIVHSDDSPVALVVMERLTELIWEDQPEWIRDDYYLVKGFLYSDDFSYQMVNKDHANRPLTTAAEQLTEYCSDFPYNFDLHKGNVMLRNDLLVITDPLCS